MDLRSRFSYVKQALEELSSTVNNDLLVLLMLNLLLLCLRLDISGSRLLFSA